MREKIIDAIFDSWTEDGDTDFIRQRKDEATQAMHNTVADLLCDVEERAFKDGLHYGIDLMTGRMFSEY